MKDNKEANTHRCVDKEIADVDKFIEKILETWYRRKSDVGQGNCLQKAILSVIFLLKPDGERAEFERTVAAKILKLAMEIHMYESNLREKGEPFKDMDELRNLTKRILEVE